LATGLQGLSGHFVGFDALAGLEEVAQDLVEDLDVIKGTGGVRALYPHEIPAQNADSDLVSERGLPQVFVAGEGIPSDRSPSLQDPEVCPVDGHDAVVAHVPLLSLLEVVLRWRREGGRKGGRG
jgi:hypothetical protein